MSKQTRVIIFERLRFITLIAVLLYGSWGFKIVYINADLKTLSRYCFRKLRRIFDIQRAFDKCAEYEAEIFCQRGAMDNVERVYERKFAVSGLIKKMVKKTGSLEAHSIYKKALSQKLYDFFQIKYALIDIFDKSNLNSAVFVPEEFTVIQSWIAGKEMKNGMVSALAGLRIPAWGRLYSNVLLFFEKVKWVGGFILFPVWIFFKIRGITLKSIPKKRYKVGFRIYSADLAFHYAYRRIDFLLDGKDLNKDNTIFCVETAIDGGYREKLKKMGYNIADLPRMLNFVSISFLLKTLIKDFLLFWLFLFRYALLAPDFFIKTSLKGMYTYLHWKQFLERYSLDNYVVYNDYVLQHIVRNILFSRAGTETWYYLHSCNFGDLFLRDRDREKYRTHTFSYLYYDNLICWAGVRNFMQRQSNYIGNYRHIGCLWGEHVKHMSREKVKESLGFNVKGNSAADGLVIGVFDTTFGEFLPHNCGDMVLFIEDILKLLEDLPGCLVVFKEKNPMEEVDEMIIPYFQKLKDHPRCRLLPGEHIESSEVIKISDLVISACFTSPTIEALASGKKAVYFDPNAKFKGSFYDRFPNMVAHSYAELKTLAEQWLYKTTQTEFNCYLDRYIKKELYMSGDGKAITRFRELLTKGA